MVKARDSKRKLTFPCFPQGSKYQVVSFMSLCWLQKLGKDKKNTIKESEVALMISGLGNALFTQNRLKIGFRELQREGRQTFQTQTPRGKKAEIELQKWNGHFKVTFCIAVKTETVESCWMNWPCLESCFHVFFPDFLEGELNSLVTGRWDKISAHLTPFLFGLFSSVQEFSPHQSPPINFVYRAPSRKTNACI